MEHYHIISINISFHFNSTCIFGFIIYHGGYYMGNIVQLSSYDHRRKSSYSHTNNNYSIPRYKTIPMNDEMKRDLAEVMKLAHEIFNDFNTYYIAKHNLEVKAKHERQEYLRELDEFEELIHGKHGKLID